MAADPFEVRMKFSGLLYGLNASVTSAQKVASFALKYKDMDEDLHSCILEQLEKNNMNNRANIMYFIEHLCDLAKKDQHTNYIKMMQRDVLTIIDAVAPSDGSGAANVKVVRRVLGGLQQKAYLEPDTVQELEECLKDRDTNMNGDADPMSTPHGGKANGAVRPDKRQIEQRIEEDRERHKKQRESIWAVKGEHEEFDKLWDDGSDIEGDDELEASEDAEQRAQAAEFG